MQSCTFHEWWRRPRNRDENWTRPLRRKTTYCLHELKASGTEPGTRKCKILKLGHPAATLKDLQVHTRCCLKSMMVEVWWCFLGGGIADDTTGCLHFWLEAEDTSSFLKSGTPKSVYIVFCTAGTWRCCTYLQDVEVEPGFLPRQLNPKEETET